MLSEGIVQRREIDDRTKATRRLGYRETWSNPGEFTVTSRMTYLTTMSTPLCEYGVPVRVAGRWNANGPQTDSASSEEEGDTPPPPPP